MSASIGRHFVCIVYAESSIFLDQTGILYCYGLNDQGQTIVPGEFQDDIYDVQAGDWHTCAVKKHYLGCWGLNDYGQLEYEKGYILDVKVKQHTTCVLYQKELKCFGKLTDIKIEYTYDGNKIRMALGYNHVCFYHANDFKCIGDNDYSQLNHPTSIKNVEKISSYGNHTCAVLENNQGVCWGDNASNQLEIEQSSTLYRVNAGDQHTCLDLGFSYHRCYGTGRYNLNRIPKEVAEFTNSVTIGGLFSCSNTGGLLSCFGKEKNKIFNIPEGYLLGHKIAAGLTHICASNLNRITRKSRVACWGHKKSEITPPASAIDQFRLVRALNSGFKFSCAIMSSANPMVNSIICWGINDAGQLDVAPSLTDQPMQHLYSGAAHSCAVDSRLNLVCWGQDAQGQSSVPKYCRLNAITSAVGYYHSCMANNSGGTFCWGFNSQGQADVPNLMSSVFKLLFAGGNSTCGIDNKSNLQCWGSNKYKQLEVPARKWVHKMAIGEKHGCAFDYYGKLFCWGDNEFNQANPKSAIVGETGFRKVE